MTGQGATRMTAKRPGPCADRGETGTAIVEFAFVTPILLLMLVGIIQFGAIFFMQSHMVSVARETARYVAVGQMTATEATTSAQTKLVNWTGTFTVNVTEPGPDVLVDISVPMDKAALFDIWGLFQGSTLQASVIMRKEI
jgi:hypothetical protein